MDSLKSTEYSDTLMEPRGTDDDICLVEYYLLQPAPAQWVAVGRPPGPNGVRSLLVGAGATEDAAVMDLRDRCPLDPLDGCVMVRLESEEQFA